MKKYLFVISFLVAVIFIAPNVSLAVGVGEGGAPSYTDLQAQIQSLLVQIQALQAQMQQGSTQPQQWCYDFKYNLNAQSSGKEIGQLQIALEKEGFEIDAYEKTSQTFGESTADAVVGFQQKYREEILSLYNLKYGTGFVGKSTRAKLSALYGCGVIRPEPKPPVACLQVITSAKNIITGECKIFPNSCIPSDWQKVSNCSISIINLPPTISGVSGPTTLNINQSGIWEIKASDPEQGNLNYQVFWGDEAVGASAQLSKPLTYYSQTTTFTHSYFRAGIYYPTFTVTDNQGLSAKTSISLNVGSATIISPVLSISPTNIIVGNTYTFSGSVTNAIPNTDVKLYLQRPNGTMKYENYYVGKTDANGVLKITTTQNIPNAYCCTYSAWVEVGGQKSNPININITPTNQPSITVLSPNGGEVWKVGETRQIKWNSVNASNSIYIDIFDQPVISTILPITPTSLAVSNTGYYNWAIPPVSNLPGGGKSTNYLIRVHNGTGGLGDSSNAPFSVVTEATTTISLPDLIIEDVKLEPTTPIVNTYGGEAKLTFAIANRGNATVNNASNKINPVVYPDKSSFFYAYKESGCAAAVLEPGQSCYFYYNISFIPTKIGVQNMIIEFDSSYNIQELDINNNKYVYTFTVVSSTTNTDLSDLIVTDLSWEPQIPLTSNIDPYLYFNFTIKNNGAAKAFISPGTEFALYEGSISGSIQGKTKIGSVITGIGYYLLPGESKVYPRYTTFQDSGIKKTAGNFELFLVADSANTMKESNENNNGLAKLITISSGSSSAPSITVLSPNGGETFTSGASMSIKWSVSQDYACKTIVLYLIPQPGTPTTGSGYIAVANGYNVGGKSYPTSCSPSVSSQELIPVIPNIPAGSYKMGVYVFDVQNNTNPIYAIASDQSDAPFSIAAATTTPSITVLSPNGGEALTKNSVYRIKWNSASVIDKVSLGYSFGTGSLNWIATNISNTGYYDWIVNIGNTTNNQAKIYIIGYQTGVGSWSDYSDNYFTVTSSGSSSGGDIVAMLDADNIAGNIIAGTEAVLAKIKFTAVYDNMTINKMQILVIPNSSLAYSSQAVDEVPIINLYDGATKIGSYYVTGSGNYAGVAFVENLGWTISKDNSKILTIKRVVSTIENGADVGASIYAILSNSGFEAKGITNANIDTSINPTNSSVSGYQKTVVAPTSFTAQQQMASVLQSAEKILMEMFNYLSR